MSSVTTINFNGSNPVVLGWTLNAGASNYAVATNDSITFTGAGIVINGGSLLFNVAGGGSVQFVNDASAGSATLISGSGGTVIFDDRATAGNVTIQNTELSLFLDFSTAGNANISNLQGVVRFTQNSSAGNATITTGQATTEFTGGSSGGNARFITNANGVFDISQLASGGTTAGSIAGSGSYLLGAKQLSAGGNNDTTEVSGVISGVGGALFKAGTGTLTLSGVNTYSGGTTISAGILQLGNGGATGSITGDVLNNATLAFDRSNTYQFDGVISGSGGVRQNGGGITVLTAANNYSGGTTINAGVLQLGNGGATGAIIGNVLNNATLAFNRSNTYQFDGAISGSGGVQQNDGGTTILTAANNYSGGTTINAGVLQLGNGGATGAITGNVLNNATLAFNRSNTYQFDGAISGCGSVQRNGVGTTVLTAANNYSGGTTINAGILQIGNGGATGAITGNVLDNATLAFNRSNLYQFDGTISGSGGLQQNGGGTTILTAANSYSGGTTINSGILQLGNGGTTGAITGNVLNNAALAFNRSNLYQFDGAISGNGGLQQNGGGTTALTAANSYAGGTTISAGVLQLGNGGATGAITGNVLNNATLAFNRSNLYQFDGVISGSGGVQQNGGGTTILTAAHTYSGATTVNAGTLLVEGSIAASSLTAVNAGGTLGGTGTLGSTVINGGTLSPGHSVGTITVSGILTMTAAASYLVEVSPANADRTNVTGAATLGGNVLALWGPGTYLPRSYTILHADGGLNGTFSGLTSFGAPANFATSLSYATNDVILNLTAVLGAGLALNRNQQAVANGVNNAFNGGSTLPAGLLTVFGLTGSNLATTLTQLSGEVATGTQQATFGAMDKFVGLLNDPFSGDRGTGRSEGSAMGYADDRESNAFEPQRGGSRTAHGNAYAAIADRPAPAAMPARPWRVWGAGYGGTQSTDGNAIVGSNYLRADIAGGAAGVDYRISPDTLIGFGTGGATANFKLANGLGAGRSNMFQTGIYGRSSIGSAYLAGALAYGWQEVTTDRNALLTGLRANFDANSISGRIETGYRHASSPGSLVPYAAARFTTLFLPAYTEQSLTGDNTFALSYRAKNVIAPRSELGLRADTSFEMQDATVTLRGRAAWAHNFSTERSIGASFLVVPAASFVVNGAAQAPDLALVTLSAETRWSNGFSLAAAFDGEFSGIASSYTGKGIIRYQW